MVELMNFAKKGRDNNQVYQDINIYICMVGLVGGLVLVCVGWMKLNNSYY